MTSKTFSHFTGLGSSSCVAAQSHILRCSSLMLNGPPEQCSRRYSTALAISSSPGILSSNGKVATSMGIGCPGGRMWAYSSSHTAVRFSRDTRAGGGGMLAASLYHPLIRTQTSITMGVSDARRESIVRPESSARLF